MIVDGIYVSLWDGGNIRLESSCKVNLETKEVFDIEPAFDVDVDSLDEEFVEINGQKHRTCNRFVYDGNDKDLYWYKQNLEENDLSQILKLIDEKNTNIYKKEFFDVLVIDKALINEEFALKIQKYISNLMTQVDGNETTNYLVEFLRNKGFDVEKGRGDVKYKNIDFKFYY